MTPCRVNRLYGNSHTEPVVTQRSGINDQYSGYKLRGIDRILVASRPPTVMVADVVVLTATSDVLELIQKSLATTLEQAVIHLLE